MQRPSTPLFAFLTALLALAAPAALRAAAPPAAASTAAAPGAAAAPHRRIAAAASHAAYGPAQSLRLALAAALLRRDDQELARRVADLPAGTLTAPVALPADARLRVMAIRPDRVQHRTLFLLRAAALPRLLPFWVSVPGELPYRAPRRRRPAARWRPRRRGPLLVHPHRPALLTIVSAGMRIELVVIPLQQGRRGQLIRLEDPANRRFITGTVTGKNQLEANL
jgi:hypothetical protein